MKKLTITRPDDWHVHLRDGKVLWEVLPDTARRLARGIVMPNLTPPIYTVELARAYRERIALAIPDLFNFVPLMTIYLTDKTSISEVRRAKESGFVQAYERNKVVGVLSITSLPLPENCFYIILPMGPEFLARQLYTILREFCSNNLDCILVEYPPRTPGWAAVHDRLTRAGSPACMTHISL